MGHLKTAIAIVLGLATFQDPARPACECKPREVGPSGSRQDWKGYRKGIDWHYSIDEAARIAAFDKKIVFWFHLAGDLDKEGC